MREEFSRHFNVFKRETWVLASGTVVDEVIAEHVKMLPYELALHSFIIEDVEAHREPIP